MRRLLFIPLLFIAGAALADGAEGGYKDDLKPYRHPVFERQKLGLREYISPANRAALKRIHAQAMRDMERDRRRFARGIPRRELVRNPYRFSSSVAYVTPRQLRHADPQPVRYRRYEEPTDRSGGRECRPAIKAVGEERGWRGRALTDALNKWRTTVIAEYGYSYSNFDRSKGGEPDCGVIRTNKFGKDIYVCSVRARPCRGL